MILCLFSLVAIGDAQICCHVSFSWLSLLLPTTTPHVDKSQLAAVWSEMEMFERQAAV